ncbi:MULTISPECIES: 50S ribosomal protein L33 [Clostridia]|nr:MULTISPECIES: 50S ribosomal protein L33 [Clostridia]NBJ70565.1 50S ribosomal protein L33 [Roseburia sp. 1XD42-34]RKI76040.1 50S ribosomal protein L33 [Clostridium sp. 1xD42-85]
MNKKITLACAVCANRNYTTNKNVSTQPVRLEVNKYCKFCGKHTLHKETK